MSIINKEIIGDTEMYHQRKIKIGGCAVLAYFSPMTRAGENNASKYLSLNRRA